MRNSLADGAVSNIGHGTMGATILKPAAPALTPQKRKVVLAYGGLALPLCLAGIPILTYLRAFFRVGAARLCRGRRAIARGIVPDFPDCVVRYPADPRAAGCVGARPAADPADANPPAQGIGRAGQRPGFDSLCSRPTLLGHR